MALSVRLRGWKIWAFFPIIASIFEVEKNLTIPERNFTSPIDPDDLFPKVLFTVPTLRCTGYGTIVSSPCWDVTPVELLEYPLNSLELPQVVLNI